MKYFSNFPIISYANNAVRNIFAKVKLDKKFKEYTQSFYPYDVQQGDRPDVIAYGYYDDSYNDWMVYFANQMVDPYYDYFLDSLQFDTYIDSKYGSMANAQSQIFGYRNNWYEDDTVLTTTQYEALATNLKKHWAPVIGYSGSITGYERSKSDSYITTNRIVTIPISLNSNTEFIVGERIQQTYSTTIYANATITFANSTVLTVQHTDGGFVANTQYTITGKTSLATAAATDVVLIKQNFANNETLYYSAYSAYDYEEELNRQKAIINLVDNRYASTIERQFRQLLSE